MPFRRYRHDRFWLQGDIQPPEIDFRLSPNFGHSEAHAGLPVLTRLGHPIPWPALVIGDGTLVAVVLIFVKGWKP